MKKLILILVMVISLQVYSQKQIEWTINVATMGATEIVKANLNDCVWRLSETNTGLTGTINGTLIIMESIDGVNWNNIVHPSIPYTIQKDTAKLFVNDFFAPGYIGFKITKDSMTAGTINLKLNFQLR